MTVTSGLPHGWTETTFGAVVSTVSTNEKKLPRGQYLESGRFPVVDQGQRFIGGYSDDADRVISQDLPLLVFGDHTRAFKYLDQPFVPGADGVKVLKPLGVDAKWLYLIAHALDFPDKGYARHFQHLNTATLFVPPLPEQRQIVAEIEKQFTRLEAGVAALRRVQANLKRYRAAVLKAACEGRLVPTDAELAKTGKRKSTFETGEALLARILTERRKNWQGPGHYKEPTTSATTNLPPLAEGWTWASVSQVSATIVDCPHSTAKFVEAGHPCVDTTCIKPGRIVRKDLRFVSQATFQVRVQRLVPAAKDIIFAREGTVGTAVAVPPDLQPCLGQRVMLMRPDTCIAPRYFEHSLNSHAIRSQYLPKIVGSTAPHLNVAEVKQLAIPLPPLAEQTRIVAEVERRLSVVEELEAVVSANLQRATRLRQSILQKAFTGELV